jgi:hypothetical protein
MVDVDCAVGSAPCLTARGDHGYEIDEAEVVFWGPCPGCLAAARTRSDEGREARQQGTVRRRARTRGTARPSGDDEESAPD